MRNSSASPSNQSSSDLNIMFYLLAAIAVGFVVIGGALLWSHKFGKQCCLSKNNERDNERDDDLAIIRRPSVLVIQSNSPDLSSEPGVARQHFWQAAQNAGSEVDGRREVYSPAVSDKGVNGKETKQQGASEAMQRFDSDRTFIDHGVEFEGSFSEEDEDMGRAASLV